MASVNVKHEDPGLFHLTVGTEVSAKYRGAFCEAQIKSIKKNVIYKVTSKRTGKSTQLNEENIRGHIKIGSSVEALFPDQTTWQEGVLQSAKDKSSYTVVFDDGDERTLTRGSLCLKGDRHYAKSETLDNLPLTDPENFGTPVLAKKKIRRRRPANANDDDEIERHRTPDGETVNTKEKKQAVEVKETFSSSEEDEEDDDEKRTRWLSDPLMGRVVIVEPNDKRKHWYPGLVVNPLCFGGHQKLQDDQLVVRSFRTGKFFRPHRSCVKEMSLSTIPSKLEPVWKSIVEDAQNWQTSRVVPKHWKMDVSEILDRDSNTGNEDDESGEDDSKKCKKKSEEGKSDAVSDIEKEKSNHDFLEELYKFMEDRGTPINKTPVLGYKDLNLFLLYKLVQKREGSFAIKAIKEWKQIYLDLGIPKPNPAAGYNVKTAYQKYLGTFEEYCASWRHIVLQPVKGRNAATNKERKKMKQSPKEVKQSSESKKSKDKDASKAKTSENTTEGKTRAGRNSPVINIPTVSRPRRRMSESSSASDITNPTAKPEKKKTGRGLKRSDSKRVTASPESEADESTKEEKAAKKETGEKRQSSKGMLDGVAPKRMRRNSTSSVLVHYSVGDRLKVKYGQGPTFKLYDAKVLRVKAVEALGQNEYFVHYAGWNARHDEWIQQSHIVGYAEEKTISGLTVGSGKILSKRPKTPNSARGLGVSKDDLTPTSSSLCDVHGKFPPVHSDVPSMDDDLPDFELKRPRASSLLKKNLQDEFRKALGDATGTADENVFAPIRDTKDIKEEMLHTETPSQLKETQPAEKEMKMSIPKLKEQAKSDEAAKAEAIVKSEVKEVDNGSHEVSRERSISPSEGSSVSETSEDNSNVSDSSTQQVRRTSSRRSKSPAYYGDSSFFQTTRRRRGNGKSGKSRSPTPDIVEASKSEDPKGQDVAERDSKTPERTLLAKSCDDNHKAETERGANDAVMGDLVNTLEGDNSTDTSVPDRKNASSPTGSVEGMDIVEDECGSDEPVGDNVAETIPSSSSGQANEQRDDALESGDSEVCRLHEGDGTTFNEQAANEIQAKSPRQRIRLCSKDTDTAIQHNASNMKDISGASPVSAKETTDSVVAPELSNDTERVAQCVDRSSTPRLPSREEEVVNVPVPFPDLMQQSTPLSSKVLIENTPPTTPEQSPTYSSEDHDMEPEKHSPSIDSDVPDMVDDQKSSADSASSSGCEQPSTSENMRLGTSNSCGEGDKCLPGSASKKKSDRSNRSNKNRMGAVQANCNNDSESDEEQGTSHRKRRASTSKYKPRKKRAKARPEPPSAPPPLPREELDGMPQDERIALLQARMAEMRKVYQQLKQEVANIDRKRKRAKRREREAAEAHSLASKSGSATPTPSKSAARSDVAASNTVEKTESVSKGKDEPDECSR